MSNFRNKVRRRRSFLHKEASNLDGPLSRFFNETYPGSRILKASAASADPALQLPTDVAGLFAWYDAGDLSTLWQDTAKTTQVAALDDPVNAWDDKSGNGVHLENTGGGSAVKYKPAGYNGVECLDFDKTAEAYLIRTTGTGVAPPLTIISTYKNRVTGASYTYTFLNGSGTARIYLQAEVFGAAGPGFYDNAHTSLGVGEEVTDEEAFTISYDTDNTARFYRGTTEIGSAAYTPYSASPGFRISTSAAVVAFDGVIREVAVFSIALIAQDREYVVAGMRARAGLS